MGISDIEHIALKDCHEAGQHVCDHVKSHPASMAYVASYNENLNGRGHLIMKLSVGGTQSLNATCKLLIAEKTFYIFVNEKNF